MISEILIIIFLILITLLIFWKKNFKIASSLDIFDDYKSNRKIKKKKTPLTGGLILMSFIYLFYFFNLLDFVIVDELKYDFNLPLYFIIINLIFFLGLIDDKIDLSPNIKLLSFILIFFIISYLDKGDLLIDILRFNDLNFVLNIYSFSIVFIIFCLIVFVNAANMFDGINLQCSSYFLFLNIYLQLILKIDALLILLMIGLIFFMFLNYKNKSYLGDSGVYILAFITGIIIIKSYNEGLLFCDQILLMMLIPGIDMIRLTFLRVLKGNHPFKADNNHIHHILGKKLKEKKISLITMSIIIIPNFLGYFFNTYLIFVFVSLYFYFYIITKYNNVEKKIR